MLVTAEKHAEFCASNITTEKYMAWSKHFANLFNELLDMIIDAKTILVENIIKASALISDIQLLTKSVPYQDELVDMTDDLYVWVSITPCGYVLRDFFAPPE